MDPQELHMDPKVKNLNYNSFISTEKISLLFYKEGRIKCIYNLIC